MYHEPEFEPDRQEMMELLEKNIPFLEREELIPLWEADGRTASRDLTAPYDLPNRNVSACDGIAVHWDAFAQGMPDTSRWKEGHDFVYSNTGVALPDGYDTVIPIEEVTVCADGRIRLQSGPSKRGDEVGMAGEIMKNGECLVTRGDEILPADIGLLTPAGYKSVPVYARPTVLFIPTGDELVPGGGPVPDGKNVESNGSMLHAYIRRFGGKPVLSPIIPDEKAAIRHAVLQGISLADLVVIGAGSSKGSKDFTMDVLDEIGTVLVQEIGVAPGKHCSLTIVEGVPVIGIPGPPGGAQLITQYYVKAAIELLMIGKILPRRSIKAVLDEDIPPKWIDFMQSVELYWKDDILFAHPLDFRSDRNGRKSRMFCNIFYCRAQTAYKKGTPILAEPVF